MNWITVRIKASGQIVEMVPHVGRTMIDNGLAEEVRGRQPEREQESVEVAAVAPVQETASVGRSLFRRGRRR